MPRAYFYRINSLMNKLVLYTLKIYRGDVLISYSSKQLNIIRKIKYKHISLEYDGTHIHKVIIRTLWNSARKKQQKKKKKKNRMKDWYSGNKLLKQISFSDIFILIPRARYTKWSKDHLNITCFFSRLKCRHWPYYNGW